jgi:hypothetical protein
MLREVREVHPSRYLEAHLSSRLATIPTPFRDLSLIYSPDVRIFLVDDVGLLAKGPLWFNQMPDVHVGFWDRILAGREAMCRELAQIVAQDAGAQGVWTAIPKEARATLAFAKRTGFRAFLETPQAVALSLLFT